MDFLAVFSLGAIIGSFLNVCIYRIPLNSSVVFPASHCGKCNTSLKITDLIPIISFLFLRGRCRYCQERISWRYPLIELVTGIVFTLVYREFGLHLYLIPYLFFFSLLIVISFIDIDHFRIPDKLIILGLAVGIVFIIFTSFISYSNAMVGFFAGGGILFTIALASKGGMGGGDIKLGALIGVYVGWKMTLVTLFLAAITSALFGIGMIAVGKKSRKDPIPFGPFLAVGSLIALLWGDSIIRWYYSLF